MDLGSVVDGLAPKHILLTFAVGIIAGFAIVVVDNYVVQKLEAAVGVTPGAA